MYTVRKGVTAEMAANRGLCRKRHVAQTTNKNVPNYTNNKAERFVCFSNVLMQLPVGLKPFSNK